MREEASLDERKKLAEQLKKYPTSPYGTMQAIYADFCKLKTSAELPLCLSLRRTTKSKKQVSARANLSRAQVSSLAHHLMISEQHRFVLCGIPEVGVTEWRQLFLRLTGDPAWNTTNPWYYPHYTPRAIDFTASERLTPERLKLVLQDPSYFKAVFFRDPVDRLLSAFLDKFMNVGHQPTSSSTPLPIASPALNRYARDFLKDMPGDNGRPLSFQMFVEQLHATRNVSTSWNPHWRPQHAMCLLDTYLPLYDFVGDFSFRLESHAQALLRHLSLWDEFGAQGWPGGNGPMFSIDTNRTQMMHVTGSTSKKAVYYTPRLQTMAREVYADDYDMLRKMKWGLRSTPAAVRAG